MRREIKTCQNCTQEFRIGPEDFAFYEKTRVPPPTWCPECRMVRRMAFRNERFLYKRKDEATGQDIFSGIPPEAPIKTYTREYWLSDAWDPMYWGRDYDFSRPFFEQFRELMQAVPWPARNVQNTVNSNYAEHTGNIKDCYLFFDGGDSENCLYAVDVYFEKDSVDVTSGGLGALNYDSLWLRSCQRAFFSSNLEKCHDVWFSRNLTGCSYCFGCMNLRNRQYHIFNKPYTKDEYLAFLKKFNSGSWDAVDSMRKRCTAFWGTFPNKYFTGYRNVDVTGDLLGESRYIRDSWNVYQGESLRYCQMLSLGAKDSYDHTNWGDHTERIYESFGVGLGSRNVRFSLDCWPQDTDVEYSVRCQNSHALFGCVGLRNTSYCILNKRYSGAEYAELREKIIRHMNDAPFTDSGGRMYRYGEYFPPEFSPFSYEQTLAHELFPKKKEEATSAGFVWRDAFARNQPVTLPVKEVPDRVNSVTDAILNEHIGCMSCGRAFRIIPGELSFYRSLALPVPRRCSNCRYTERMKQRNPPRLYSRNCECMGLRDSRTAYNNVSGHFHGVSPCPNEFETSYAPERPEIVYCESCYNSEVV